MVPVRIIPRLDVKGQNVVKGIHLEGLRIVGSPGDLARRYYADGADEILFMDVVASLYGRNNILDVVKGAAENVFVPLTVGGGIRTLEDIVQVLRHGADKVAINTAAIKRPSFLSEAANAFGSQCIVLSVEAKSQQGGHWEAYTDNGRERTGVDVLEWASQAEDLGVGEVYVTSVDREGTGKGFDLALMQAVRERVSVPVVASGGAGQPDDLVGLFRAGGADAACCASVLHYDRHPISALKTSLDSEGVPVRL